MKFFLDYCETPDKESGKCIRLNDCQVLRELLQIEPLNDQDRDFLKNSQCKGRKADGYPKGFPWVCCASNILPLPGSSLCGTTFLTLDNRIFGGTSTSLGEFPWFEKFTFFILKT